MVSGFLPRSAKGQDVVSGFWPGFPNGWDVVLTSFTVAPLTTRAEREREREGKCASSRGDRQENRYLWSQRIDVLEFFSGFVFFFFSLVLSAAN